MPVRRVRMGLKGRVFKLAAETDSSPSALLCPVGLAPVVVVLEVDEDDEGGSGGGVTAAGDTLLEFEDDHEVEAVESVLFAEIGALAGAAAAAVGASPHNSLFVFIISPAFTPS